MYESPISQHESGGDQSLIQNVNSKQESFIT
jgi:hypothetical protein